MGSPESAGEGIFGPPSEAEIIHNRIMNAIETATQSSEYFATTEEEGDSFINRWFYITGMEHQDPVIHLAKNGDIKQITIDIRIQEEYEDIAEIGFGADGERTMLMRNDPMAELVNKEITIYFNDSEKEMTQPEGYKNGWDISYAVDNGWGMKLWKLSDNGERLEGEEEGKIYREPSEEDLDQLRIIMERVDKVTVTG